MRSFTVFQRRLFWKEQLCAALIFAVEVLVMLSIGLSVPTEFLVNVWVVYHHENIHSSIMRMVFGFVMLLLGFFTTTNYARWWRLRTLGIGRIWSNAASLTMYLCTLAPEADGAVIKAIDRYARASLMWLFMTQRGETSKCEKLVLRGLLISEEADLLNEAVGDSPFASTCIWGWIADILQRFRDCGALDSFLFVALMDKVNEGRSGAELVLAQLSTPIPVSYIAFIGWLTKMSAALPSFRVSFDCFKAVPRALLNDCSRG